jgi:prolyl-tRNA editing enzyme YbaK/EbsC (Cys-tRNA(Pro) deacylase)
MIGKLRTVPAIERTDLLAEPVARALTAHDSNTALVTEIDPTFADTAQLCAAYDVPREVSANCVIVAGKRDGEVRIAACVVLATTRADVNNVVRKRLDVRKASFLPMSDAVAQTGMEYGGITPVGLPEAWPVLVDAAVAEVSYAVVGSGLRQSKLLIPGKVLAHWPNAEVIEGLGR